MFDHTSADFLDEAIEQTFESRNSVLGEKLCQGTVLIEWVDLSDDGIPEDKAGISVLHFDVSTWGNTDGWTGVEGNSYITQIPVNTEKTLLQRGLEILMTEYQPLISAGYPIKRLGEQFRLFSVDNLKKNKA